jgi:hypothetical protein
MKKAHIPLVLAGILAISAPFLAYADDSSSDNSQPVPPPPVMHVPSTMQQTPPVQGSGEHDGGHGPRLFRAENAQNNRDFRNTVLRKNQDGIQAGISSSTHPALMMIRAEREHNDGDTNDRTDDHPMLPSWLTASSSPFREHRLSSSTMMELVHAAREGSTTELRGHENRESARLVEFAQLQSNLIAQLNQSFDRLQETRTKIADRIQSAEQSGRDMTEATSLLATADQKMTAAEQAIQAISNLTPSVSSTNITASTTVSLEKPREVGKTAIQALNDARKALNDVVVAIAHAMGLRTGDDGHVLPPPAATSTSSTTQQ